MPVDSVRLHRQLKLTEATSHFGRPLFNLHFFIFIIWPSGTTLNVVMASRPWYFPNVVKQIIPAVEKTLRRVKPWPGGGIRGNSQMNTHPAGNKEINAVFYACPRPRKHGFWAAKVMDSLYWWRFAHMPTPGSAKWKPKPTVCSWIAMDSFARAYLMCPRSRTLHHVFLITQLSLFYDSTT